MFGRIHSKVEGMGKVLKEIKDIFFSLSKIFTSYLVTINQLVTLIGKISTNFNPRRQRALPSYIMVNRKNEA